MQSYLSRQQARGDMAYVSRSARHGQIPLRKRMDEPAANQEATLGGLLLSNQGQCPYWP